MPACIYTCIYTCVHTCVCDVASVSLENFDKVGQGLCYKGARKMYLGGVSVVAAGLLSQPGQGSGDSEFPTILP